MSKFKVGDKVKYCSSLSGTIGCIHGNMVYMSECSDSSGVPYFYPCGGICKEHNTMMGYGMSDMVLVEEIPKYKVGQLVRVGNNATTYTSSKQPGYIGSITEVSTREESEKLLGKGLNYWYMIDDSLSCLEKDLELVGEEPVKEVKRREYTYVFKKDGIIPSYFEESINSNHKIEKIMENCGKIGSKVASFVKNLSLSSDEKLLRKYGLHDECGRNTYDAKEAILERIFGTEKNQSYLIEIAEGLEAEANKNK